MDGEAVPKAETKQKKEEKKEKKTKADEEEGAAEEDDDGVLEEEPVLSGGLGSALELLRRRGVFKEKQKKAVGEVIIERLDEHGREMTPKQAFKHMSHIYHGEAPSMRKREKMQRQEREEQKRKFVSPNDTPLGSLGKMREAQKRLAQPFIVLEKKITASDLDRQIEKRIQKQGVEPAKSSSSSAKKKAAKNASRQAKGAPATPTEEPAAENTSHSMVNPKKRKQVSMSFTSQKRHKTNSGASVLTGIDEDEQAAVAAVMAATAAAAAKPASS